MTQRFWNVAGNGLWDVASFWTPSGVPAAGDDTHLDYSHLGSFAGPYSVTVTPVTGGYTIGNLTMDSSGHSGITLNFSAGVTFTMTGQFVANGSALVINQTASTVNGNTANFNGTLTWNILSNSVINFSNQIAGSGINFNFSDATANRLSFGNEGNAYSGTVSGFQANNVIDLRDISYGAGGFTATASSGNLVVMQGGQPKFTFAHLGFTNATVSSVKFVNDGAGGVLMMVCYAAGTRIETPHGETAVEALRPGDAVMTLRDGALVPETVRWVGHRRVSLATHPRPEAVAPIRIAAGAFAEDLPHRDLLVSPDHALLVDGALIPAHQLVNHMTIRQETDLSRVTYYHVELDEHAVLLAEGLPAESYLDTGNRGFFANGDTPLILHPELVAPCAPYGFDEPLVRPVWQRLHDRALALGYEPAVAETTDDAALHLEADGRRLAPLTTEGGRYVFALPADTASARLVSRSAPATAVRPWLHDRRELGVSVARIRLHGEDVRELALDDPRLTAGWWAAEREGVRMHRWTSGDAMIPLAAGTRLVEIEIVGTTEYALRQAA